MVHATNAIVRRADNFTLSAPAVHRQSKSPLPPGSPSRRQRSKSPPVEKVAAAQKVRVVAQEDLQREQEFALMKKNVSY